MEYEVKFHRWNVKKYVMRPTPNSTRYAYQKKQDTRYFYPHNLIRLSLISDRQQNASSNRASATISEELTRAFEGNFADFGLQRKFGQNVNFLYTKMALLVVV